MALGARLGSQRVDTGYLMANDENVPSPAVERAVRILGFLAHESPEAGLSDIATALDINKSTCFNILKTLAHTGMVTRDTRFPVYRLGPKLVELGTASRRNYSYRAHVKREVEPLVEEFGFVCLIAQVLTNDAGFVVVDRVMPKGQSPVIAPIGHVYPLSAPAMGRATFASRPFEEVVQSLAAVELAPDGDLVALREELQSVREIGYGTSVEEYAEGVNAVASAVVASPGEIAFVLCMIGPASEFSRPEMASAGTKLAGIAEGLEEMLQRTSMASYQ